MAISNTQIGATETTILTATAETAVLSVVFCNTTSSAKTVTVYAYASGGSAGDSTTILKELEIAAYDTFIWTAQEKLILDTSGVISAIADTGASVTATANYKVLG